MKVDLAIDFIPTTKRLDTFLNYLQPKTASPAEAAISSNPIDVSGKLRPTS
jgi:hypothetical protein